MSFEVRVISRVKRCFRELRIGGRPNLGMALGLLLYVGFWLV